MTILCLTMSPEIALSICSLGKWGSIGAFAPPAPKDHFCKLQNFGCRTTIKSPMTTRGNWSMTHSAPCLSHYRGTFPRSKGLMGF